MMLFDDSTAIWFIKIANTTNTFNLYQNLKHQLICGFCMKNRPKSLIECVNKTCGKSKSREIRKRFIFEKKKPNC